MLLLLAPAKLMDFESPVPALETTRPAFAKEAGELVKRLRALDLHQLAGLMGVSDDLAALTRGRFQAWKPQGLRPALLAYAGEAYAALDAASLEPGALALAQRRLRILSGLYGVLRPLDAIRPYRLEMATRLETPAGPDLHAFWRNRISAHLAALRAETGGPVVNLASEEYAKAVDLEALGAEVVSPVFQSAQKGGWKVLAVHAKRARGLMVRFALQQRLEKASDLRGFDLGGWRWDSAASGPRGWVFRRRP